MDSHFKGKPPVKPQPVRTPGEATVSGYRQINSWIIVNGQMADYLNAREQWVQRRK